MDMQAPIVLTVDLLDDVIEANAKLNLSSGEITDIKYVDYSPEEEGFPADRDDYEFSSGVLKFDNKEVEFAVDVEDEEFSVNTNELQEIKSKIAALVSNSSSKKKMK